MTITREDLAAYADGQLEPAREAEVAAAVAADSALAAEVEAHRALRRRLGHHFAPMMQQPVPDALAAMLKPEPESEPVVADIAAAREKRRVRSLPRWGWIAGPALAATLALAVFLPRGGDGDYAKGPLADTLEQQLVAEQGDAETRILLSFRDGEGAYCRAFAGAAQSGIACRDDAGWRMLKEGPGAAAQDSEYRMAGSPEAALFEQAQAMADGPALDAEAEQAARERGWR